MSDIVERLREISGVRTDYRLDGAEQLVIEQAADLIQSLRALVDVQPALPRMIEDLTLKNNALQADKAELRKVLDGLREAVETDAKCQGYDPRNVVEAHTYVALAMKEADEALAKTAQKDGE